MEYDLICILINGNNICLSVKCIVFLKHKINVNISDIENPVFVHLPRITYTGLSSTGYTQILSWETHMTVVLSDGRSLHVNRLQRQYFSLVEVSLYLEQQ